MHRITACTIPMIPSMKHWEHRGRWISTLFDGRQHPIYRHKPSKVLSSTRARWPRDQHSLFIESRRERECIFIRASKASIIKRSLYSECRANLSSWDWSAGNTADDFLFWLNIMLDSCVKATARRTQTFLSVVTLKTASAFSSPTGRGPSSIKKCAVAPFKSFDDHSDHSWTSFACRSCSDHHDDHRGSATESTGIVSESTFEYGTDWWKTTGTTWDPFCSSTSSERLHVIIRGRDSTDLSTCLRQHRRNSTPIACSTSDPNDLHSTCGDT